MKPITKQTVKTASKFVTIGLLIGLLIGAFIAYGQSPSSTFTISSGVYPGAPSYTIWTEGGEYFAKDANGRLAYSGTNASQIIISCISALPSNGGKILLIGTIILTFEIPINHNSVEISGENIANDLYFVRDGTYHGVTNKAKTVIVADGITAFHIGSSTFNFGISIKNLMIVGSSSDADLAVTSYSAGAGINITRGNSITIENVAVIGKEYGIYTATGSFASDKVIDLFTISNLYLAFNVYGIYQTGWVADSRWENIRGYLNQKGLIHAYPQYNVVIDTVSSFGDNWNSESYLETPIYIGSYRDVTLRNIVVKGIYEESYATNATSALIFLEISDIPEWGFGAYVTLENVFLFGSKGNGIEVTGNGAKLIIKNLIAGIGTKGISFYGGASAIDYYVAYCYSTISTDIIVDGGFINCSAANKNAWFYSENHTNQIKVSNIEGWYNGGQLSTPLNNALDCIGLLGNNSTIIASKTYIINGIDLIANSTGGTGVSITIKDAQGNTITTGLTELNAFYLPKGYSINFGTFSVAPTVTFHAVNT